MKKNSLIFSIFINSLIFSMVGIVSIFSATKILIAFKSPDTKLLFNAPVATLIAVFLFYLLELLIKKNDKSLLLTDLNHLVYSAFLSFFITIIIVSYIGLKTSGRFYLKWQILQYLFILIPINAILILIKLNNFYRDKNERNL